MLFTYLVSYLQVESISKYICTDNCNKYYCRKTFRRTSLINLYYIYKKKKSLEKRIRRK